MFYYINKHPSGAGSWASAATLPPVATGSTAGVSGSLAGGGGALAGGTEGALAGEAAATLLGTRGEGARLGAGPEGFTVGGDAAMTAAAGADPAELCELRASMSMVMRRTDGLYTRVSTPAISRRRREALYTGWLKYYQGHVKMGNGSREESGTH